MQQNGRKKRTAKVCVWQMWQDYYLHVLSTCFTKRSVSRKVKIGKKLLSSPILFQCLIMIRKNHCPVSLITRWALDCLRLPPETQAKLTLVQGPKKLRRMNCVCSDIYKIMVRISAEAMTTLGTQKFMRTL